MKLIFQPPNSKVCGHACLAMIAGISLEKAIKVIGHRRGTNTKTLVKAFEECGFETKKRLIPIRGKSLPPVCICKMVRTETPSGNWHWVVHNNGKIYDPSLGLFENKDNLLVYYSGWKITSYLEIKYKE